MMQKIVCECCGGKINPSNLTCEYCGTRYQIRNEFGTNTVHIIRNSHPSVIPLRTKMEFDSSHMSHIPPEQLAEISMQDITHRLAEALAPYVEIETYRDLYTYRQIVQGTIRVVEPNFRFY